MRPAPETTTKRPLSGFFGRFALKAVGAFLVYGAFYLVLAALGLHELDGQTFVTAGIFALCFGLVGSLLQKGGDPAHRKDEGTAPEG